jgi:hypothetical protein
MFSSERVSPQATRPVKLKLEKTLMADASCRELRELGQGKAHQLFLAMRASGPPEPYPLPPMARAKASKSSLSSLYNVSPIRNSTGASCSPPVVYENVSVSGAPVPALARNCIVILAATASLTCHVWVFAAGYSIERLLRAIEPGDVRMVCRLDRQARSTRYLLSILDARPGPPGAVFRSLKEA